MDCFNDTSICTHGLDLATAARIGMVYTTKTVALLLMTGLTLELRESCKIRGTGGAHSKGVLTVLKLLSNLHFDQISSIGMHHATTIQVKASYP
jgi:hypothetical protein